MKRPIALAAVCCLGALVLPSAASSASATAPAASLGGFATDATATPIRIEIHDPSIPIPANPQLELNLSYTNVTGSTGPDGTARASALWPGDPIGTGLKVIGDQLGLPDALTKGGYPLQTNAANPGGPASASQEPLPGSVTRATSDDKTSVAKAGYSAYGDVAPDSTPTAGSTAAPTPGAPDLTGLLTGLSKGDLTGLGQVLTGSATPASPSPLGALGVLVKADGMSSVSSTDYSGDGVTATATSRLGDLSLLAGIVDLKAVSVTATTSSTLAGAKTSYAASFSGLSIAGQSFTVGRDGITAVGKTTAIPGLPDAPAKALAALGLSFDTPEAVRSVSGPQGSMEVKGLKITLDIAKLRKMLPALPLSELVDKIPSSAGQLKTVVEILASAAPQIVIYVGNAKTDATTVAAPTAPTTPTPTQGGGTTPPPTKTTGGGTSGTAGTAGTSGSSSSVPVGTVAGPPVKSSVPTVSPALRNVSDTPGLPPLGSVPGMLLVAGLVLAGVAGWWLRRAGLLVLGSSTSCPHGLRAGLPDLRKV